MSTAKPPRAAGPGRWVLGVAILVVGTLSLAASWERLRVQRDPSHPSASRFTSLIAPSPKRLAERVDRNIKVAVAELEDANLPPADRLAGFEAALREAESLIQRGLEAHPLDADAIAELATLHWELATRKDDPVRRQAVAGMDLAASLAPSVPGVQRRLGSLLLSMGRRDEALQTFRRSLELSPRLAPGIASDLRVQLFPLDELIRTFPPSSELFVALEPWARETGQTAKLTTAVVDHLEDRGIHADEPLIRVCGKLLLGDDNARELHDLLAAVPPLVTVQARAERDRQRSRALMGLGRHEEALAAARSAREQLPQATRYAEFLASTLLELGQFDDAIEEAHRSLSLAATGNDPLTRARLYTLLGRSEEARGEFDRAYDAYARATKLSPDYDPARRNLDRLRSPASAQTQ
ncbi:MAG: tetratricopeptide repeat protein [Acidobacteriota bacterium]|nr:tetratricopeptide repeat protein [Acidobacteriota bacterium]MDH3786200.1 tetratricopeptide repeat protein [Acidobacteriota bacterium]